MHPWFTFLNSIQEASSKIFQEATYNPREFWSEWGKRFAKENEKRFSHWGWGTPPFQFLQNSYSQFRKMTEMMMQDLPNINQLQKKQMDFFLKLWLDAISPNNIPWLNPEVWEKIMKTGGMNIIKGFMQLMEDISNGSVSLTNISAFEIGKNIASTKGSVIMQTPLFELIAYEPRAKLVNKTPIFIVPSWINKFYIVDLTAENSLVKWLLEQGFMVYTISWVNPKSEHNFEMEDYIKAIKNAGQIILEHFKTDQIHAIGYCFGGNALLAAAESTMWKSITLLASLIDFNLLGDLKIFINEEQIHAMKKYLENKGYMEGKSMQWIFQFIRANDLIWSAMIKNYWLGEDPITLDFLYWNSDSTNIPYKTHLRALESWCWKNELYEDNFSVEGKKLKLSEIKTPVLMVGAKKDHITPWQGCFAGMHKFKNADFILCESGHIAGIINVPSKEKYGYYHNSVKEKDSNKWFENAEFKKGSWWPFLSNWLYSHNSEMITPPNVGAGIRAAPGEYVKIKS